MKFLCLGLVLLLTTAPSVGLCSDVMGEGTGLDRNKTKAEEEAKDRSKKDALGKCEDQCRNKGGVKKYEAGEPVVNSTQETKAGWKAMATCTATCDCFNATASPDDGVVYDPLSLS